MKGLDKLRRAAAALEGNEGNERSRLRIASGEFEAAAADAASWPSPLRAGAAAVWSRLHRSRRPLGLMSDDEVRTSSERLRRFCAAAERNAGRGHGRPGQDDG